MSERDDQIAVRVPAEPPVLTRDVCRILVAILIELTEVPVPEEPRERGCDDC